MLGCRINLLTLCYIIGEAGQNKKKQVSISKWTTLIYPFYDGHGNSYLSFLCWIVYIY
jgi:hypothetical protein